MNMWMRQAHRWLSAIFILTVVTTSMLIAKGEPPAWAAYLPLLPLALLALSGIYLFALPYLAKRRAHV